MSGSPTKPTVTMTFHIDPELKREVTEIVRDYGLNLTSVTRAFYKQIVRDGSIPLSFRHDAKGIDNPYEMLGVPDVSIETERLSGTLNRHPENPKGTSGVAEDFSDMSNVFDVALEATSENPRESLIG